MKKAIAVLFMSFILIISASAGDSLLITFDESICDEITVFYRYGGPVPPNSMLETTLEYRYCTKDKNEIKQIIKCVNGFSQTPVENVGKSFDGIYLDLEFNIGDEACKELCFDVLQEIWEYDGQYYEFVPKEYDKLSELIYSFRTKNDIKEYFDDTLLRPYVAPVLINGRTLIPVQALSEVLDADVKWNGENRSITLHKDNNTLIFILDENYMIANGETIKLDVGGKFIDQYGMVPVRALCEFLGLHVEWKNNAVYIGSKGK